MKKTALPDCFKIADEFAGLSYIACVGMGADRVRIAVDLEIDPRSKRIIVVNHDRDANRLSGLRKKVAYVQMGAITLKMRDYLEGLGIPQIEIYQASELLKYWENYNG